jgi:glycosyltransferase involved in cell wall biosynthesis
MPSLALLGCRGIPARYGGFETVAEALAVRFVPLGYDVTVFCQGGARVESCYHKGVRLIHVPTPLPGVPGTLWYDAVSLYLARKGFDVVYMLGYGTSFLCWIPSLFNVRVWINMDGIEWARRKWGRLAKLWLRIMERVAMRVADAAIVDSLEVCRDLQSRYGSNPVCAVIPYGAEAVEEIPDPAPLTRWGLRPGEYYLVVSRFEPENQVLEVIRGFRRSNTDKKLVLVGNNQCRSRYVRHLVSGHDPRILFVGTVYDRDLLTALRCHAFAYLHGHTVGGTNPSLLEAMACGNPVIAHDNRFNHEVARDAALYFRDESDIPQLMDRLENPRNLHRPICVAGQCKTPASTGPREAFSPGVLHESPGAAGLCKPFSAADLHETPSTPGLHENLSPAGLRQTLSAAGRQRIRTEYNWDRIVKMYQAFLDAELANGGAPSGIWHPPV